MKKKLFIMIILGFWIFSTAARAEMPMDTVKAGVDMVIAVAGDKTLTDSEVKRKKMRTAIGDFFDFYVLSRLTLGRDWKNFKPDQQKEFVELYRAILENVYMGRILAYTDEKVAFSKEIMHSEKKAEVQSKVITKNLEIPIHYRMVLRNGKWKVYDVVIEGVSLVKNYRSQFGQMLVKESPEALLKSLREKIKET